MKKKDSDTMIHIQAESEVMSVDCIVPENKANRVLVQIRDNFLLMQQKFNKMKTLLKVKTSVHNPKLF